MNKMDSSEKIKRENTFILDFMVNPSTPRRVDSGKDHHQIIVLCTFKSNETETT